MALQAGKFMHKLNKSIHHLNWKDIAVFKIDIIFAVLLLVNLVPELSQIPRWASLIVVVLCEIYLYYKMRMGKILFDHKKSDRDHD